MSKEQALQYTGESQPPKEGEKDSNQRVYFPYLPSDDLKEAVNLAIALQRPLLLEGEPGCGKTRLAGAVAYEFTHKYLRNNQQPQQWWNYYIWNIKSTTRARDGLYTYNAVARLRDAQLVGTNLQQLKEFIGDDETKKLKERLQDKKNYREFGALGKALQTHPHRPILLIDEIDKADSDFANDLLLELEELRFEIPETGEPPFPTPEQKPIIFITSNQEKPLPEPFLRRCLAATTTYSQERIEGMSKFFTVLSPCIRQLIWLNPLPQERWEQTSAWTIDAVLNGKMLTYEPASLLSATRENQQQSMISTWQMYTTERI